MTAKDPDAHPKLTLSGDFDSPTQVIASDLEEKDKRAILETWENELTRADPQASDELLNSVRDALARLDSD